MPTLVELEQLLDIALTTPEVGTVNFNILRMFLHEILRHLNIENKVIDVEGLAGELKTAYDFVKDGFVEIQSRDSRDRMPESAGSPKTVLVTEPEEQIKEEQDEEEQSKSKTSALVTEDSKSQTPDRLQESQDSTPSPKPGSGISVKDHPPSTRSSVMLFRRSDSFGNLKKKLSELQERVESLESQPAPVPDPVRSAASLVRKESRTPAHDFVELINIKRKLEASENSIEGLTEMVDALTSDINELKELLPNLNNDPGHVISEIEELKNSLNALKEEKQQHKNQDGEASKQLNKLEDNEQRIGGLESMLADLKEAMAEFKNTHSSREVVNANDKDEENTDNTAEISEALQKLETHEKQLQSLAAQIQDMEMKIEGTDAKSSGAEQAASDALVRLEACGEGVSDIREKLAALDKDLKNHKSLIEDNEMQIHQLKNTMTLLQRESLERANEEAEKNKGG